MPISFNKIPKDVRVPGSYVEADNSNATNGLATDAHILVLTGQMTSAGTATAEEMIDIFSSEKAAILFGVGSQLHLMCKEVFENQNTMRVQCIPLADADGAAKATNTITVAGTPAENGTLHLHIGGEYVAIGVIKTDTATTIADKITDKITAEVELPVICANTSGVATLTAKNGGSVGNDCPILINWNGESNNEVIPTGITVGISAGDVGATDPDVDDAIAVMPDTILNHIVSPFSDTVNMTKLKDELDRRWLPTVQLEGHAYASKKGTASALATIGEGHNSEHLSVVDAGQENPTPAYILLCGVASVAAVSIEIDPARPVQTLEVKGVIGDKQATQRNYTEATTLLNSGIATCEVNRFGQVLIQRLITTYQTSPAGAPDISYLDANTLYTISFLRQTLINRIRTKYPRHKLASNGTKTPSGQAMVTPNIIKAEIIALSVLWGGLGLVENLAQFAEELAVERNLTDPNRIDAVLPTDLVNQFRVFAASIKFIL